MRLFHPYFVAQCGLVKETKYPIEVLFFKTFTLVVVNREISVTLKYLVENIHQTHQEPASVTHISGTLDESRLDASHSPKGGLCQSKYCAVVAAINSK